MALIDVIQHPSQRSDEIVFRVPQQGAGEFKFGSQLIVREGQAAVFFRDGKALDTFGPGRHTLNTNNLPLLTGIMGIAFGGATPFTAEVYFVSLREFSDLRWGTAQPVVFRDTDFGMVRLRAFGGYSMRVGDPQLFVQQVVGSQGVYTIGFIEDYLRGVIVNEFNDMLGAVHTTLLDLPGQSSELAAAMRNALVDDFRRIGLDITSFQVIAITPPDDVQRRIDERTSMSILGDSGNALQSDEARALPGDADTPEIEAPQRGLELGTGLGVGEAMAPVTRETVAEPARLGRAGTMECPHCHAQAPADARFCPNCGRPLQSQAGQ
ncbi:MAG TPA: SPFH domain-containing protein [Thermomicrobiales bacterium]|jgi:membrane protease subunit (stomatin/prohibitin family)|nr:SPFH domain-containing protein [Thermomicrobiales bacterium]